MPEHRQDPQDKQFGAQARRDADVVDEMASEGLDEEELPGEPSAEPQAGNKAEPGGER